MRKVPIFIKEKNQGKGKLYKERYIFNDKEK